MADDKYMRKDMAWKRRAPTTLHARETMRAAGDEGGPGAASLSGIKTPDYVRQYGAGQYRGPGHPEVLRPPSKSDPAPRYPERKKRQERRA